MPNRATFIFEAIDKFTAVGRKISRSVKEMTKGTRELRKQFKATDVTVTGTSFGLLKFGRAAGTFTPATRKASVQLALMSRRLARLKVQLTESGVAARRAARDILKFGRGMAEAGQEMTLKISAPLAGVGVLALKQAATFETLGVRFKTLVGDAGKAEKVFGNLTQLAAQTPFQLADISDSAARLLSFGESADTVVDTLRRIGDVAAGSGSDIKGLSLVFGQIRAKGRLMGEEVLQLAERGIAIIPELQKVFPGATRDQLQKAITAGQVKFSAVQKALKQMTSEGGKFNNLTKEMSGTLSGLTSTLKDTTNIALAGLGDLISEELGLKDALRSVIKAVGGLTTGMKSLVKEHPVLGKILLAFMGILIILPPLILAFAQLVIGFAALKLAGLFIAPMFVGMASTALAAIPALFGMAAGVWAVLAPMLPLIAVVALVMAAFVGLVMAGKWLTDNWDLVIEKFNAFVATVKAFTSDALSGIFGFSGELSTSSASQTDINVNVNAPPGVVSSVKTKTAGNASNMNVGMNMVGSA